MSEVYTAHSQKAIHYDKCKCEMNIKRLMKIMERFWSSIGFKFVLATKYVIISTIIFSYNYILKIRG